MANLTTERVDLISDLPDSILYHISFMDFSQIAQTSLLSERWIHFGELMGFYSLMTKNVGRIGTFSVFM